MTHAADRRALIAGALALAAAAALPARAQETPPLDQRGYALGDVALGAPDAPVTVIEYASFTCPHCATFHTQTWPEIKAAYVDTGKVRFLFREVYFDQFGLWAAMIARCGGPATYHGFVTTLFENQAEWSRAEDPVQALLRVGRLGGLSAERMDACLRDEAFLERLVADYQAQATADGIRSTPSFLIDGALHAGAIPVAEFSALLDAALAAKGVVEQPPAEGGQTGGG
jgi:protein-disulfide isomerase